MSVHLPAATAAYSYAFDNPYRFEDRNGAENIVVVGSQTDDLKGNERGNRLIFADQAVGRLREYAALESEESRSLIVFRHGYSNGQLQAMEEVACEVGAAFVVVDSADEFIHYVSTMSTGVNSAEDPTYRERDTVSNLDMFAHGVVGAIEFGYGTTREADYRLNTLNVWKFDPAAFGPDTNSRPDGIQSLACRTGLGNPLYDSDKSPDLLLDVSLAQYMAYATQWTVHAYVSRSDYDGTLGSRYDRRIPWARPDLEKAQKRWREVDGATFAPYGPYRPVRAGPTPEGLPDPKWRRLDPSPQKNPVRP